MKVSVTIVALLLFIQGATSAQTTLFPFGSNWKYLDNGSNQGTAWRASAFNDSGWPSGPSQLGFGEGDEDTELTDGEITYYFRSLVNIPDVNIYSSFNFEMYRDDGIVIYINGMEVFRNNMPNGTINFNTGASQAASDDGQTIISANLSLAASQLTNGNNVVAVEVHQNMAGSSDLSFDMKLTGLPLGITTVTTGPYLQKATSTSMVVRWYTASAVDSKVSYGTSPGNLSQSVSVSGNRTNHTVTLNGLTPYTQYYYSIETSSAVLQSGPDNYFLTLPNPASTTEQKYTFWVTGDVGDNSSNQRNVRDRFINYMGNNPANGWLLLGDNAYYDGLEDVYITNFFDIYENNVMRNTPLWPATGNHEYENNVNRQRDHDVAYFDFFETPTLGEAGGVASNKEAYYSFNYGNIHFIALDSYIIERIGSTDYRLFTANSPQMQWLIQDLQVNTKQWTIVYFHHPPYSMGSHNSDTESQMRLIRENVIVPILEQYGVDLVLSGHSHSYERSRLMKGHSGLESTFSSVVHNLSQSSGKYDGTANSCPYIKDDPNPDWGSVYVVAGSGGMLEGGESNFPHNAMYYGNDDIGGSMILEVEGNRLDAKWLASNGSILDKFTMMKEVNNTTNLNIDEGDEVTLTASWIGQYNWSSGETFRSIDVEPVSSGIYTVTDPNLCLTDTYNITVNSLANITIPSVGFTEICAGSTVNIAYTISGTFTAGNTFTLQLSNASGSFSSPVNIGSLSGNTSGTINGLIPVNTTSGSNYRLRVVSSSPVVTGGQSAVFTINALPSAPVVGTISQPTCSVATGGVTLSGLPSSGTWTLTRTPGSITTTGTGTSTTISGLATDTYTYTVTSASGCVSSSTANIVINAQPVTPTAPAVGTITQPTCSVATGSVVLSGLPSSGTWTLTRSPGGNTTTGTGTSTTITGLPFGTYTYTVTNAATCISPSSSNVVIDLQPATPTAPVIGTITQPTCSVVTGSVEISGLPSSGTWTLTRSPGGITTTGSGVTTTISGLSTGTYTYIVTGGGFTCDSPSSTNVVINAQPPTPTTPIVGTISQPTCSVTTGSVVLNGLPSSGTWTLTRTPGGTTTTGTGTSTTISGLAEGTYTYTVTNAATCVSPSSSNVVINAQLPIPTPPVVGTITQPTCSVATGSVILSGLPSSGTWTLTRTPGGTTTTGTGTSTTISGLAAGTYTYTVEDESTCVSVSSADIVINAQPVTPTAPVAGTITQPTCSVATGSVILNGLPPTGTWTLTRNPGGVATTGTGASTTISGLSAGTYTYTVENESICVSVSSANIVINTQPITPTAPVVGTITQPSCSVATGSVILNGLPSSGTWTLTRSPGGTTTTGSGTSTTISLLPTGTYTFTVTNASTCVSPSSSNVVIDTQPSTPSAPVVGTITQPTCTVPTGSVALSGLPSGAWTINPGAIAGSGATTTINGLTPAATYNFIVIETATGCSSVASANVVINAVPTTASPIIGTITQPTCTVPTGSVALSGLPSGGWTINPGAIAGSGATTTLTLLSPSTTFNFTVTETATGCISVASANVVINAVPTTTAPIVGTITQPTCTVPTGSVALSGLPSGAWTINPGAIAGSGATTTINGLTPATTFNFTVTETATGCISDASANVVINAVPTTTSPIVGTITQPTCTVPTGSVALSGLPFGAWTINPGAIAGSGTTTTINGLTPATTFNFIVTETATGCISVASTNVVINAVPTTTSPIVGTITQPTCTVPTGSVALSGLPFGAWTINPGAIAGSGATTTINGLTPATTFNFTVTETATGCISVASANVVINTLPTTTSPIVGTITQPTCTVPTGSVALSGLPSGAWTINPGAIAGSGATTTLTLLSPSTTFNFTVTESATGCISVATANVVINSVPASPTAPTASVTTQPTCSIPSGIITITAPANGVGISYTVTGTNPVVGPQTNATGVFTGLTAGEYDVTTTDNGCTSAAIALTVNVAPGSPAAPTIDSITQPTCSEATGSIELSGLPSSGTWTLTRNPGGIVTTGTGTSTTISGLASGTYTYAVEDASNCISPSSIDIVINVQPETPTAPVVDTISQPTCSEGTGSVVLSGLPSSGTWTLTRAPGGITTTGTGTSATISELATGTYTYTVTNASTCVSLSSSDVVIDTQPATPTAPTASVTTQPTCSIPTGIITITAPANGVGVSYTVTGTNPVVGPQTNATGLFTGLTAGDYDVTTTVNGCTSAAIALTVNVAPGAPAAPTIDSITQPTCSEATGSIELSGLPSSGTWTLTRSPGGIATTGTGTSTTISGLASGTYTYAVEDASNCISPSSIDIVINVQPETPTAPVVDTITQPTCSEATGSVVLSGLPSSGTWTLTRTPGGITTTGTGTSATISELATGTYTYTVTNASTCVSLSSSDVVIDTQPASPTAPTASVTTQPTCSVPTGIITITAPANGVGISYTITGTNPVVGPQTNATGLFTGLTAGEYDVTTTVNGCTSAAIALTVNVAPGSPAAPTIDSITQPTCSEATGSIELSGLPSSGTWTLTRNPGGIATTGTGTSTTISGLASGTYTYAVEDASNCISPSSIDIVINVQPETPTAPVVDTITQPTCSEATGSVVLSGLPSSGTWTLTRTPGGITTTGTGTSATISELATGTYTYTVTNASTCVSLSSLDVVIDTQPATPTAPTASVTTQPTCSIPTGIITITAPANGVGVSYTVTGTNPVVGPQTNATGVFTGLTAGEYDVTTTDNGCTSAAIALTVNVAPGSPAAPTIDSITQPTCSEATGSVELSGLPSSGTWTLTRNPGGIVTTGTGTSTTISGLTSGTYTYAVEDASNCISPSSIDIVINVQPNTPVISDQTTSILTGETFIVTPSGVPFGTSYTWTSPTYTGDVTGGSAQTLPQSNISGSLIIPTGTGTATYTVTPTSGICIGSVFSVTVTVIYDPLPVELVNFTASVDEEKVTLNWKTASELNNDFFEVQRFVNQEKINVIGRIIGHGTTNETNEYEFVDVWPLNGVAYYRLKQVDVNGQYEYSNILRVIYDGTRSLKLYPNPGDGTMLNLALGMDEGFLQISVLDAAGRNISKSFTHTLSDSNVLEVLFESNLAPGMYFIHVKSSGGITSRKWIVK